MTPRLAPVESAVVVGAILELRDVVKVYGRTTEVRALDGVNLTVVRGELAAIVGPSGSGKSTLLNLMGALDRPTSGEVRIQGRDISTLNDRERSRLRADSIGFVFQQFNLIDALTALDNVATALLYRGVPRRQRRAAAADALEQVGLAHRSSHRPAELSGGECQRVAIARAIVGDPAIVLADEPTGNLDTRTGAGVAELLCDLNDAGRTIVVITHDLSLATRFRRSITIRDGRIEHDDRVGRDGRLERDALAGDRP
jgi:putative ABC transport system ATP-binding protein